MKVIAIICEYNLFHNGHALQFELIRDKMKSLGEEYAILSLMSGNWVQRGESAVLDKYTRAEAAVRCGSDIVLELPYPWSGGCAEHFARGAVSILNSLGFVDYLCFGCESMFDADRLLECAERVSSWAYEKTVKLAREKNPEMSDITLRSEVFRLLYGDDLPRLPNDILALEYTRALVGSDSKIKPLPVRREGDFSATAVRKRYLGGEAVDMMIPDEAYRIFGGRTPIRGKVIGEAVMSLLRLYGKAVTRGCEDTGGGLGERIASCADKAGGYGEMLELCATKRYTDAKIRRASLNILFGTTRERLLEAPRFTTLLAASKKGLSLLSKFSGDINIITKPSDYRSIADSVFNAQYKAEMRADSMYALEQGRPSGEYLTRSPYIRADSDLIKFTN